MSQKLIIIRGNSGSGKGTIAKRLREELGGKVAVIGQDALRRDLLMEKDSLENIDVLKLLDLTAKYCLDHGYTVIIEGILATGKYHNVLSGIMEYAKCDSYVLYLDVSLEETIRRHATKPNYNEFGEEKIREWYKPNHHLNVPGEIIIPESSSIEETVNFIKTKL